jgi:hypothetical protein
MIRKPALHNYGKDSQFRKSGSVPGPENNTIRVRQAMVAAVHSELMASSVGVRLSDPSGSDLGIADWPYPGFVTNKTGTYGGGGNNLHGVYTSPQTGMSVLTGFREGSMHCPIVIGTYALPVDHTSTAYTTPIVSAGHMSDDVVLGHYSGAYVALRSTVPLPGELDIHSPSTIYADATISIEAKAPTYTFNTKAKTGKISMSDTAGITLDSSLGVDIKSTTGVTLDSSLSIKLKTNNFSVEDTTGNKLSFVGGVFTVTSESGMKSAMTNGEVYAYYSLPTQVGLSTHTQTSPVGPTSPPTPGT